jgi:hypothetical protein
VIVRQTGGGTTSVLRISGGLALVEVGGGSASVEVAGTDRTLVDGIVELLSEHLDASTDDESRVPMDFWAMSGGAARSARSRIPAPTWDEIRFAPIPMNSRSSVRDLPAPTACGVATRGFRSSPGENAGSMPAGPRGWGLASRHVQ